MALPGHIRGLTGIRYPSVLATKTRYQNYLPLTPRSGNMPMWAVL